LSLTEIQGINRNIYQQTTRRKKLHTSPHILIEFSTDTHLIRAQVPAELLN